MNTEIRIRNLINLLIEKLKEEDSQEILEYLDHNEWGIAFENLVSIILSERIQINEHIFNELIDLGNDMEIELNDEVVNQFKKMIIKE